MNSISKACLGFFVLLTVPAMAQNPPLYVQQMEDPSVNFYTVQESFETYWEGRDVERGQGWKQFKRWEAFMEPRVFPTGERPDPSVLWNASVASSSGKMAAAAPQGDWTHIGPFDGNALNGIGRVNCLTFHPNDPTILFAGAPAGGLWRSDDGGVTWSTNTDLLPNLGVSSIAIDPLHPDTMYIATGDRDAGDTYSIGILKSTDGGQSWQTTGLSYTVNQTRRVTGLYINPKNTQVVVATTRNGIVRSTDGGTTFNTVQGGSWQMLTYVEGASDTLYAGASSGGSVARSIDAGQTWMLLTNGLPGAGGTRVELATTADDPNYVYAIFSAGNNGLYGIYKSVNGGETWTQTFSGINTQNLLHWNSNPGPNNINGSSGGQGWYDLAIAVSPIDKDLVYIGGVNIWSSVDGGNTWFLSAHWFGGGGADFAHADQHFFRFKPNTNELYVGNDGGVYRTNDGVNYDELCDGLHITQYYRIDISEGSADLTIGGAQDNGTHLDNSGQWDRVRGGDGMDNAIAENNPSIIYAASQYGNFAKSNDGGQSFNAPFNLPVNGSGQWVTPIVIDPNDDNTIYIGFSDLWKSVNAGVTFTALTGPNQGASGMIDVIAIAPGNSNIIYIGIENAIYRSTNGGSSWTNISGGIGNSRTITDIAVSDVDPSHVIITKSGYDNGEKVFESLNAGVNWTNISGSLPNIPANTVSFQNGTNGSLYVGTDLGVYYRQVGWTDWEPFMSGLPNVIVNDLEIHYNAGIIRAGTYGRGVWESPLASDTADRPEVMFSANPSAVCGLNDTITLLDKSLYGPTSWDWTILPNTYNFVNGTNAQSRNPQVVFTADGQYTVQLIAANQFGSDTLIKVNAMGVGGKGLPYTEDFAVRIDEEIIVENPDGQYSWEMSPAGGGSIYMNFFDYNAAGQIDEFILPPLDLTGVNNVRMTYDMAYRGLGSSYDDSLRIYISTDCGTTWTLLQSRGEDGSQNFATGPNMPALTVFEPSSSADWRNDTLDLSGYDGMNDVRIKFTAISGNGNNLYLDNINIDAEPGTMPTADFFANAVACEGKAVTFTSLSGLNGQNHTWYFQGGTPAMSTDANPVIVYNTAGIYDVSLVVDNGLGSDSLFRAGYVQVQSTVAPSISISTTNNTVCEGESVTLWATVTNGGSDPYITWYVNGVRRAVFSDTLVLNYMLRTDTVHAELISNEVCAQPAYVVSSDIVIHVNPLPIVFAGADQDVCIDEGPITLTGNPAGGTFSGTGVTGGNVFNPSQAGVGPETITYEYTDANGCTNTDLVIIDVKNKPSVFLTSPAFCESDPLTVASGGFPLGGSYSIGGNTVANIDPSLLGPGRYEYSYTYSNGICSTTVTDTVVILAAPPSNPPVTVTWGSITCNLVGYRYQWLDANGSPIAGETNQVFYPTAPGNYAVRVSAGSSCSETSNFVYIENIGLDEQLASSIGLKLFPNPTTDRVVLTFRLDEPSDVGVELTDLRGRVLQMYPMGTQTGEVEIPLAMRSYAKGVYLVKLTIGEVSVIRRVVLE